MRLVRKAGRFNKRKVLAALLVGHTGSGLRLQEVVRNLCVLRSKLGNTIFELRCLLEDGGTPCLARSASGSAGNLNLALASELCNRLVIGLDLRLNRSLITRVIWR